MTLPKRAVLYSGVSLSLSLPPTVTRRSRPCIENVQVGPLRWSTAEEPGKKRNILVVFVVFVVGGQETPPETRAELITAPSRIEESTLIIHRQRRRRPEAEAVVNDSGAGVRRRPVGFGTRLLSQLILKGVEGSDPSSQTPHRSLVVSDGDVPAKIQKSIDENATVTPIENEVRSQRSIIMWRSLTTVLLALFLVLSSILLAAPLATAAAVATTTKGERGARTSRNTRRRRMHAGGDDDDRTPGPPKSPKSPKKSDKDGGPPPPKEHKHHVHVDGGAEPEPVVVIAPTDAPVVTAPTTTGGVVSYVESHESVVKEDLQALEQEVKQSSGESRLVTLGLVLVLLLGCCFGFRYYKDRQNNPAYSTIP
jgi:hypothetical protein